MEIKGCHLFEEAPGRREVEAAAAVRRAHVGCVTVDDHIPGVVLKGWVRQRHDDWLAGVARRRGRRARWVWQRRRR